MTGTFTCAGQKKFSEIFSKSQFDLDVLRTQTSSQDSQTPMVTIYSLRLLLGCRQ